MGICTKSMSAQFLQLSELFLNYTTRLGYSVAFKSELQYCLCSRMVGIRFFITDPSTLKIREIKMLHVEGPRVNYSTQFYKNHSEKSARDIRFPPGSRSMTSGTTLQDMTAIDGKHDASSKIVGISGCDENRRSATNTKSALIASDVEEDDVPDLGILLRSTHRDGSLYRNTDSWKRDYNVDDPSETRLPDPTDCKIHNGKCIRHVPNCVLHIFSFKLAELTVDLGLVVLYGYMVVWDCLDTLRNYVVNISRDDPIIVKQGSLIDMAGPKRGMDMLSTILMEYDMRIKVGKEERDDYQLIDGVSDIDDRWGPWNCAMKNRIHGDCGMVDFTIARIDKAVMANVEVVVSEVQSSFGLRIRCSIGGYNEAIRLFNGIVGESCRLTRSVVAVVDGATLVLKFKVASGPFGSLERYCSFRAGTHGVDTREIKATLGLISVKVAWSTLLSV